MMIASYFFPRLCSLSIYFMASSTIQRTGLSPSPESSRLFLAQVTEALEASIWVT